MTFTDYIRSRHARDNRRADFIEDTKMLIRLNRFPDPKSWSELETFMRFRAHTCSDAIMEGYKLWREYERACRE
jgi:hypothetical protein